MRQSAVLLLGLLGLALAAPVKLYDDSGEEDQLETAEIIFGVVAMTAGLLMVFFGYRLFKIVMFLSGFFFGYWLCYTIMVSIDVDYGPNEAWIIFGSCLGSGLLIGFFTLCLIHLGLFLLGSLAGFFFSMWILTVIPADAKIHDSAWQWVFIAGMMLVMGILALVVQKPIIILGTSVVGSYMFYYGVDEFADTGYSDALEQILSGERPPEGSLSDAAIGMLVASFVTAIIGIVVQFKTFKSFDHKEEQDDSSNRNLYVRIINN